MKRRALSPFYLSLVLGVCLPALAFNYGDLPETRMPPGGWEALTWEDPGAWTTLNVTQHGLPANDSAIDASVAIANMLAANPTGRLKLFFPAGTYTIKTTLLIGRSNVWLTGEGPLTVLRLDAPSTQVLDFGFAGSDVGAPIAVSGESLRGDTVITVADATGLAVGNFIRLYLDDYVSEGLKCYGQIFRITGKAGNALTLDMPLGLNFPSIDTPLVQRIAMVENVRVDHLRLVRVRDNADGSANLRLNRVSNALVASITSTKCANVHVGIPSSRRVIVRDSDITGAFDFGGGGHGYGISIGGSSTRALFENNILTTLRHAFVVGIGANHAVLGYNVIDDTNTATPNSISIHGQYAHNNLIEGNISDRDMVTDGAHEANGPYNSFFRNRTRKTGNIYAPTSQTLVVGNEASSLGTAGSGNYLAANEVNGTVQWGALSAASVIPASLYLTSKPVFLDAAQPWPLFGPGGATPAPTYVRIENKGAPISTKWLHTEVNDVVDMAPTSWVGDWTRWTLEDAGGGTVYIVSKGSGKKLGATTADIVTMNPSSATDSSVRWVRSAFDATYSAFDNVGTGRRLRSDSGTIRVETVASTATGDYVRWRLIAAP